jgi:hypothetical protein
MAMVSIIRLPQVADVARWVFPSRYARLIAPLNIY